jgi:hypothetical protein
MDFLFEAAGDQTKGAAKKNWIELRTRAIAARPLNPEVRRVNCISKLLRISFKVVSVQKRPDA